MESRRKRKGEAERRKWQHCSTCWFDFKVCFSGCKIRAEIDTGSSGLKLCAKGERKQVQIENCSDSWNKISDCHSNEWRRECEKKCLHFGVFESVRDTPETEPSWRCLCQPVILHFLVRAKEEICWFTAVVLSRRRRLLDAAAKQPGSPSVGWQPSALIHGSVVSTTQHDNGCGGWL